MLLCNIPPSIALFPRPNTTIGSYCESAKWNVSRLCMIVDKWHCHGAALSLLWRSVVALTARLAILARGTLFPLQLFVKISDCVPINTHQSCSNH